VIASSDRQLGLSAVGVLIAFVVFMTISKVYAAISTKDLEQAQQWYSKLFARPSNLHPMAEVHEWYFATIAQITDPDGNQITLAEPGPAQAGA
jgi:predicted enzyme related to lactoylglutathione lyase